MRAVEILLPRALAFLLLLLDALGGFRGVILRGLSGNGRGDPENAIHNNAKLSISHFATTRGMMLYQ